MDIMSGCRSVHATAGEGSGVTRDPKQTMATPEPYSEKRFAAVVTAATDLLATIELNTDCMSNQIDRVNLDEYMDTLEQALNDAGQSVEIL